MNYEDAELDDYMPPTQRQLDEERMIADYEADMEAQREEDDHEAAACRAALRGGEGAGK